MYYNEANIQNWKLFVNIFMLIQIILNILFTCIFKLNCLFYLLF